MAGLRRGACARVILKTQLAVPLFLAATALAGAASAAPDASQAASQAASRDASYEASGAAPADASRRTSTARTDAGNEDLVRMAEGLLDNVDLIQMGANLLEEDSGEPDADEDAALDGGVAEAEADADLDASSDVAPSPIDAAPPESLPPPASGGLGYGPRARIQSGANVDPEGPKESPFAKLGVPVKAVPVVATVATAGAMAIWPFLIKTVSGLLKGVVGGLLKVRAKKGKKIDTTQRTFSIFGFILRPAEVGALLIAALTYGFAVCYTLQGWKMTVPVIRTQEVLVVVIYFSRSVVRFVYEKIFKLTTQYKFWLGGGLLCLGSAYLGNTLGTVGYELEATNGPKDAERILKMKAWLILLALFMAIGFCIANRHEPAKILQSGRIMTSGMALGEIMPINPMPGLKIYRWRKDVWAALFILVVPTFFLINLYL